MTPIISLHSWVSLPNEVRYRIRSIFSIPRSSNTIVSDGRVESDGTTNEDLKQLTVIKMQEYLVSTETDFHKLLDQVVARVTDDIAGVIIPPNANPQVLPESITEENLKVAITALKESDKNEKRSKEGKK